MIAAKQWVSTDDRICALIIFNASSKKKKKLKINLNCLRVSKKYLYQTRDNDDKEGTEEE